MKNQDSWRPTKFEMRDGRLRASRDERFVGRGSRWVADLQAQTYEQVLRQYARGRLLDVGAGAAPLYGVYGSLADSVTCIDWGQGRHDGSYIDHDVDLSGPIPLESEHFDTIVCTDVLEHLSRPAHLMGELARLLAPGGMVLLGVPFMYWLHEEPHDYHRYTEHRLRELAEEAGLGVERLEAMGGGVDVMIDVVSKHLSRSRLLSAAWLGLAPALSRGARAADPAGRATRRMPIAYIGVFSRPSANEG